MSSENSAGWNGVERRHHYKWRWKLLALWIVIFTVAVGYGVHTSRDTAVRANELSKEAVQLQIENQHRIHDLAITKAQLVALQRTNCGLEKFLLTARRARWDAYLKRGEKTDLEAVIGYENIVQPFLAGNKSLGYCPIPHRLLIPERPLQRKEK